MALIWLAIAIIWMAVVPVVQSEAADTSGRFRITHVTENDFTTGGEHFSLSPEALVFDQSGKLTDIKYIELPCIADVTYRTVARKRFIALEVNVIATEKPVDIPE